MQDGAPLLHWTAKGRPWNPEIQRRCLLFIHERRWHVDGMRESAVLDAIVAARADIWSGVMRMYSELVMPALRGLQHERYADFWGTQHALSGMREALGVMAVISDTLTLCAPEWGHGGPSMVNRWVELLGARAAEAQQNNDPLGIALDELLFDWNRCVVTPTAGYRRPSVEDALYQCRPVYKSCPALRDATKDQPGGPVLVTPNENQAELAPNTRMPVIAGFVGTYPQLHRDLLRVAQESRALKELFPTPDEIRFNIGNTLGWTSTVARRHGARGLREYQWARVDQSTEEGDQS